MLRLAKSNATIEFHPAGHDDVTITLRVLSKSEKDALRKRHTTIKWRHGRKEEERDDMAAAEDALDAGITGWTGVVDLNGTVAPCVREAKMEIPERIRAEILGLIMNFDELGEVGGDEGKAPSPAILPGSPMPGA